MILIMALHAQGHMFEPCTTGYRIKLYSNRKFFWMKTSCYLLQPQTQNQFQCVGHNYKSTYNLGIASLVINGALSLFHFLWAKRGFLLKVTCLHLQRSPYIRNVSTNDFKFNHCLFTSKTISYPFLKQNKIKHNWKRK